MAYNSTVILTGNTGDEVKFLKSSDGKDFATLSIATTDSYKDQDGNWQNKESIWHHVFIFKPALVLAAQSFEKGVRLKITGSLSYRNFEAIGEDGNTYTKKEATIIAGAIEEAPLERKLSEAA